MKYNNQYTNLFTAFKDSFINFKHFSHYVENMNKAKTGCYFLHNLDMALLNLVIAVNTIKHSSKKVENVLYYPIQFPELTTDFMFADLTDNVAVQSNTKSYNLKSLKSSFNKISNYLKTTKFSKATLIDNLNQIEKYMWVLYKAFQAYIDEYEKQFNK